MEYIEIDGGRELSGEIVLSGSKNSALPILASSLLSDKSVILSNVPAVSYTHLTLPTIYSV